MRGYSTHSEEIGQDRRSAFAKVIHFSLSNPLKKYASVHAIT